MAIWRYIEPGENNEPIEHIVSDDTILDTYYPWWIEQMKKAGKERLISAQNCIDDWVVVHWAERVD